MSDTEPTTGHPDNRHALGVLRGAIARGDVLELHGSEGSAAIRIPDDLHGILADVVTDLDPSDELRADGGTDEDDFLYVCPNCTIVTTDDLPTCPACGHTDARDTLAIVERGDER